MHVALKTNGITCACILPKRLLNLMIRWSPLFVIITMHIHDAQQRKHCTSILNAFRGEFSQLPGSKVISMQNRYMEHPLHQPFGKNH